MAYGTRQYKVTTVDEAGDDADASDAEEMEETVHLERGENLFEIHVKKVVLSPDGTHEINDDEPHLFGTWEFFEHEVQATPVVKGPRPAFEFTSQYIVKVDDFFLHYLQKVIKNQTMLCPRRDAVVPCSDFNVMNVHFVRTRALLSFTSLSGQTIVRLRRVS